ncbi:PocR ligand-binding domain-containing protein [Thermodesulfobacteriota bacterium]
MMDNNPEDKYHLEDLINIKHFQNLQDRLYEICSFPSRIIDNDGKTLTATPMQEICTNFHRNNKESIKECFKSNRYLLDNLDEANPAVIYRCPHGLVDTASPIIIDNVHYGNFLTGQFFFEEPDLDFFKEQVKKYGFPEDTYLEAVKKVSIWTEKQLNNYLLFIQELISIISESGLNNLREIEIRKQIEESENRTRSILETAMDGFWVVDKHGRILEVNDTYCKMTGYNRQELFKMTNFDLDADETPENIADHTQKLIKKREERFIRRQKRKDGSIFDVEMSVKYQPEEENFIVFLRDISEQKHAEEVKKNLEAQLSQAQKMEGIGTLAGGIAHDFNNILSPILMHSELIMEDLPSDDPLKHDIKEIYKAGERARDLVQQILTFAQKRLKEKIVLKSSHIVKEAIKFLRSTLPTTVEMKFDNKAEHDTVLADPTQINQIIMNLCTNASHAMREKGGILEIILDNEVITASKAKRMLNINPGEYLKITVKDNGTGIDADIKNKIFEPYFTTKGVGEGTGFGLATVHSIVQSYGGDIIVESEVGKGSTFDVYIPLEKTEAQDLKEDRTESPIGTESILFVDDEESIVNIMKKSLKRFGYKVTGRTSSVEALEAFRNNPDKFDLVITDMTMPNMTGEDLAKELMTIKTGTPVILCTGFSEKIDEEKAKEIGISSFVMKPIIANEIAITIRELLDHKE